MPRETASLEVTIRNAGSATDWQAVREICCQTGNAGAPIAAERWPFFGELWIGPYQKLAPRWTYVAEVATPERRVVGYLTGCPDTAQFTRWRRLTYIWPLLGNILLGHYLRNGDVQRFIRRTFLGQRGPEDHFPRSLKKQLRREYPAHLHVNVLAEFRSARIGEKLLNQFFDDLADGGIGGVHLYCGDAPVKFYERNGFKKLGLIAFRPKGATNPVPVNAMGRKLVVPVSTT